MPNLLSPVVDNSSLPAGDWSLLLAVIAPAIAVVVAAIVSPRMGAKTGWILAGLYGVGAAGLIAPTATAAAPSCMATGWNIIPGLPVHLSLCAHPTGLVFAWLALIIGAIVLMYSVAYLGDKPATSFYTLMAVFTVSMLVLVLSDGLIQLFIGWELTSIASFLLIARSGPVAWQSAARTLATTFTGGLALLAAVILVIHTTGTDQLSQALQHPAWADNTGFASMMAVLVAVAALSKSAQFPFHYWLVDAMAAITPVSAYLHAAAVVKAGIFLLMVFAPTLSGVVVWQVLLITAGLITSIIGGYFALQKTDVKQLMAYSTVSQLGWIVMAIGVGTSASLAAAVLYTIAHAFFKCSLFMLIGVVDHQAGTRDMRRMGRLSRAMPYTAAAMILAVASMAGIAPTLGFVAKESILTALLSLPGGWGAALLGLATFSAILTIVYCARFIRGVFFTDDRETDHVTEANPLFLLPAALPGVLAAVAGLVAWIFDAPLSIVSGTDIHVSLWHGVTWELAATLIILCAGLCYLKFPTQAQRLVKDPVLPFSGAAMVQSLFTNIHKAGVLAAKPMASDSPSRHVAWLLSTVAGFGVLSVGWFVSSSHVLPAQAWPLNRVSDAVVALFVTLGVLGLIFAFSRMTAVVMLGAVGLSITLQIFSLGAPDVGMTQLLVEILTVIVIMLVLRRLPEDFVKPSRRRSVGSALLALIMGLLAGIAAWALAGRRDKSQIGSYLLEQGPQLTGGTNIVNTILVEFRALDTLGELAVLGMSGVAVIAVLSSLALHARPGEQSTPQMVQDTLRNTVGLRLIAQVMVPVLSVIAIILMLRGHNSPGGGFIAALVVSCAIAMMYQASPADRSVGRPRLGVFLIGSGVLIALGTGFYGLVHGSFLQPHHGVIAGVHLSSAMVFDVGVLLAVVGLVMVTFYKLGFGILQVTSPDTPKTVGVAKLEQAEEASS